jgi:hypothetical protein
MSEFLLEISGLWFFAYFCNRYVIGEESFPVGTAENLNSDFVETDCQNRPVSSSSQVSVEDTEKLDSRGECSILCSLLVYSCSKSEVTISVTKSTKFCILPEGEQLTTPEFVQKGSIRFHTYQSYISAAGGYCIVLLMCLSCLLNVGSTAFSSWWLALWIKAGGGVSNMKQLCLFY